MCEGDTCNTHWTLYKIYVFSFDSLSYPSINKYLWLQRKMLSRCFLETDVKPWLLHTVSQYLFVEIDKHDRNWKLIKFVESGSIEDFMIRNFN